MYGWIITLFQQYLQLRFPSSSSVSWLRYCEVLSLSSFTSIHRHDDLPDSHTLSLLCHILDDLQRHHHILPSEILEDIGALYLQTLIHEGYDNLLRCLGSSFDEWFTNINKIHQHLESIYPNISPPEFWCVSIQHSEATIEYNEYVLYYSSHRPDATEIFLPMIRGIVREVAKEYFSTSILAMKLLTTQGIDDSPHSSWSIITMPLNEEPRISSRKYNSPMTPSTAGRCPFQQPDLGDEVRRFSDNSIRSSYHLLQSTTPHFFNHSSHSEAFSLPSPQRSPKESNRQIQQPTQDHVISSSQINGRLGLGESDRSLVTEGEELQRAEDTPHQRERPQLDDLVVLVETEEDNADASRSNDSLPKPEPRHQAPILSRFYRLFQRSSSRLVPVTPRSAGCPPNWTPAVMQPQLKPSIASSLFESIYSFSRSRSQVSALPPPLSAVETLFLSLGIAVEQAVRLYPFHILFDIQSLSILSSGLAVSEYLNMQENLCLDELFTLKQPKKFTWIMLQRSLELSAQEAMVASARTLPSPALRTSIVITVISKEPSKRCPKDHKPHGFQLTGQVICSQSATSSTSVALFLANPHVTSVSDMLSQGLSLFDLEEYPLAQSLVIQSEVMRLETMVSLQKEKAAEVQVEASQSLANEMKTVASKAEEALDVKKIFVRTVSHEIRTPLTVAKMGLSLLDRDFTSYVSSVTSPVPSALASLPQLNSSSTMTATVPTASAPTVPLIRECIEEIQLSLETAINILNDLLAYEKLESGILVTFKTLRPLRLSEQQSQQRRVPCCLMDSIRPFRLQAQEKEIELLVEDRHEECFNDSGGVLCVEDMLVHVDENKMSQVIRNLLSNAIKFTPPKGTVTVRFQYSTDTVATLPKLSPTVPLTAAHESPVGKNEKAVGEGVVDEIEGKVVEVNGERMEVQRRGTLTVEFIDSGAGISPENQRKLFREIIQFSPDKLQGGGGSGLGLWISAGIIELHGGRIGVWSAGEGEGSTFYFSLPLYGYAKDRRRSRIFLKRLYTIGDTSPLDGRQEHDEEEGEEEEHPSSRAIPISPHTPVSAAAAPSPVVSPLAALRILVVDDAPSIRKVVTRTLQSIGASCESASDGQSAINIVLSSSVSNSAGAAVFDLILMDNLMVPMGGLEATAELRRLGYSGLIIGATGNLLPEDIQLFLSAGADDVLGKPLSLADLESSVHRLLLQRSLKGQSSKSRTHTPPTTGRRPA